MRAHSTLCAKDVCRAVLEYAVAKDQLLRDRGESDLIDDKTAFIIKRYDSAPSKNGGQAVFDSAAFSE
jgi:hypothetical protein